MRMVQSWCCVVGPRGIKNPCIWSAIWRQQRRRVACIKSDSASRPFSQTRKAEVSIFISRTYRDYTRLLCFGRGEATSSRHDRLLLGKQIVKDILRPLSELEALMRIEDHGLHECLGLLTTRFPNGFDGQAPFCR